MRTSVDTCTSAQNDSAQNEKGVRLLNRDCCGVVWVLLACEEEHRWLASEIQ